MATKAFVLIEAAVGRSKEVMTAIKQIEEASSVDMVTGPYDVIAILEAETLGEIGDIVTGKIHPIDGISRTVTCLAV